MSGEGVVGSGKALDRVPARPRREGSMFPVVQQGLALQTGVAVIAALQTIEAVLLRRIGPRCLEQTGPLFVAVHDTFGGLRGGRKALASVLPLMVPAASMSPLLRFRRLRSTPESVQV